MLYPRLDTINTSALGNSKSPYTNKTEAELTVPSPQFSKVIVSAFKVSLVSNNYNFESAPRVILANPFSSSATNSQVGSVPINSIVSADKIFSQVTSVSAFKANVSVLGYNSISRDSPLP
jgi:hypothetical protein